VELHSPAFEPEGELPVRFSQGRPGPVIAPERQGLPEGIQLGYDAPLGTAGRVHRYLFRLLALDASGRVLASAELPVRYERARE
jgi:hypothetical protein